MIILLIVTAVTFTRRTRRDNLIKVPNCEKCGIATLCCERQSDKALYCDHRKSDPKLTDSCPTNFKLLAIKGRDGLLITKKRKH